MSDPFVALDALHEAGIAAAVIRIVRLLVPAGQITQEAIRKMHALLE